MDRTSAYLQVRLSNSLKFQPQVYSLPCFTFVYGCLNSERISFQPAGNRVYFGQKEKRVKDGRGEKGGRMLSLVVLARAGESSVYTCSDDPEPEFFYF